MSSDIFKINKDLITLSKDLTFFGRDRIKESKYRDILFRYPFFAIPKVIFTECCENQLGYYDKTQHVISIDLSFTPECCRETLENIYLHELAHAIDIYLNKSSKHDSKFSEICKEIGAKEEFSRAKVNINKDKIKSKIDKLLALSKSDFEGEATSALNKAKQMMLSSGLSYLYSDDEDELFGCIFENKKTLDAYKKVIISFVCRITGAFHFLSSYGKMKTIEVYGSADQVETTMYVYNDLVLKIEGECKKIAKEYKEKAIEDVKNVNPIFRDKIKKMYRVNSSQIKLGIAKGIISKNSDIEKSIKGTAIELSSVKSEEIYSRLYNTSFRKVSLKSSSSSQLALGLIAGKNINVSLNKGSITKQIGYNS